MYKMSLVIPCYNEANNLSLLVDRCEGVASGEVEVILVDNGSNDETPKILANLLAQNEHIRSVRVEVNQGYGYGILQGLNSAVGDILAWTHADMQTDPKDVLRGLMYFEESDEPDRLFIKGKRYGRPFMDVVFTVGMAVFETFLMRKFMSDINAQPTMFHKSFLEAWSEAPHDFSLDLYAYYMAKLFNYRVKRFPVRFGERAHGVSHWNVSISSKINFIKRTLNYSFLLYKKMKKNDNNRA